MKTQKAVLETDVATYQDKKQLIDDYLLKLQEEQYELKYTYDQQIVDLETMISREGEKLLTRYDWWETTNQKIIDSGQDLMITLEGLMEEDVFVDLLDEYDVKVKDLTESIAGLIATAGGRVGTYPTISPEVEPTMGVPEMTAGIGIAALRFTLGQLPKYQGGIDYVPKTGLAMIHRGERITPAGRESPSGITIDNVTINVKEIAEIDDVEKLSALLSQAESSGLMKRGKTNYRLRIG